MTPVGFLRELCEAQHSARFGTACSKDTETPHTTLRLQSKLSESADGRSGRQVILCRYDAAAAACAAESLVKLKLLITVVLLTLVIVFMIQNAAVVEVRFLFWDAAIPRSILILMMLIIGIAVGWFVRAMYRLSRKT